MEDYEERLGENKKKRIRATQACIPCRRKKIKCDGRKPGCVHCEEANITCHFAESRKRGPRKGYVQQLEERVALLMKRMEEFGEEVPPSPKDIPHYSDAPDRQSSSPEEKKLSLKQGMVPTSSRTSRSACEALNDFPPRELTLHLVDLFFSNTNATFPLIHKGMFKKSIDRGEVFNGLLWAVMAVAARFSDDKRIRTNPPHLAGEKFASKAVTCIDANTFEPTLYNLQFWGIMSAYEYGRASGARAWMYGGMAIRICLELGLNKEENLREPMRDPDGNIDTLAMALRRRIFWSCFSIDKFASAGTNRPQSFDKADCDSNYPSIAESLILLEQSTSWSVAASKDPLVEVPAVHLSAVGIFGEVNKYMNRAKSIGGHPVTWPPITEFKELDKLVRDWRKNLPERFHFNSKTLGEARENSSKHYMYLWLSAHILWATSALVLHRASLAFITTDLSMLKGDRHVIAYEIKQSALLCKEAVDIAMDVFSVIRDECGSNILPFMCYTAYIVATVLMTSTFAKESVTSRKSNQRLSILYKLMEHMEPYWPMCARVAATTKQLHSAHSRLYTFEPQTGLQYDNRKYDQGTANQFSPPVPHMSPKESSDVKMSPPTPTAKLEKKKASTKKPRPVRTPSIDGSTYAITLQPSLVPGLGSSPVLTAHNGYPTTEHALPVEAPLPLAPWVDDNTDYNSLDFLFDGTLFGQMMFDAQRMPPPGLVEQAGLDMHLFNGPIANAGDGFVNKPLWDVDSGG